MQVGDLEQAAVEQEDEHKRLLENTCAELKRERMREREQLLGERKAELDKAAALRQVKVMIKVMIN